MFKNIYQLNVIKKIHKEYKKKKKKKKKFV